MNEQRTEQHHTEKAHAEQAHADELEEAATRLARARERTRALEQQREARLDRHRLLEEARLAEIEAADLAAIDKAETEHGIGRVRVVHTTLGCVIVKRPDPILYKRFRDRGKAKTEDLYRLATKCVVHPTIERWDVMLEELPAVLDQVADEVVTLAGVRSGELAGK